VAARPRDDGVVTVELARHLVRSGVIAREEAEASLLQAVTAGVAFVKVLVDRSPGAASLVERELGRLAVPALRAMRLACDLARELPGGMCSRLLAVPIGRDAESGHIEVAAVDPLDPHIAEEFSFHLAASVLVYRAPLSEIEAALEALPFAPSDPPPWSPMDELHEERTPAFGTYRWRVPAMPTVRSVSRQIESSADSSGEGSSPPGATTRYSSAPPIPLVRKSSGASGAAAVARRSRPRLDTSPGIGIASQPGMSFPGDDATEQAIPTWSQLQTPAELAPAAEQAPDAIGQAIAALASAQTPADVVELLLAGATGVCRSAAVFAARSNSYDGRGACGMVGQDRIRQLRILRERGSVFDTAAHEGHYLGKIPATQVHAELRELLVGEPREVYVAAVRVSDKPALMLILDLTDDAFEITERVAPLVRRAGFALERIVLSRKL
jgi:hypothetical protein